MMTRSPLASLGPELGGRGTNGSRKTAGAELEQYYSIRSVAEALDVSERTVHRYIKRGQLMACRPGGLVRISATALRAFIDAAGRL